MSIYLDHNATTPLLPEVRAAIADALGDAWGNPSSIHAIGRRARQALEVARRQVAALLGASNEEIVFTSGGTEGNNLLVRGLAFAGARKRGCLPGAEVKPHIVSSSIEHPSVQGVLDDLERLGFDVTRLPVGSRGEIDPGSVKAALSPRTVLVTLATANHEIGNVYPVATFARFAHEQGAFFHTDAVQAVGRIDVDVASPDIDALTVSAHKIHGPKGVGAVFLRRGIDLDPLVLGGHQERERRAGTENVAGIVGFGEAARLAAAETKDTRVRVARLRDDLERRVLAIAGARVHGDPEVRVPGTLNAGFEGAEGELVMIALDLEGICVSTGAACTSGTVAASPVLLALGLSPERAREGVRFSLGRDTTAEEIERVAAVLPRIVDRVRRSKEGPGLSAGR